MYESKDKMVSHPSHYQSKNGLEVFDVIEAFTDGIEGAKAVCTSQVIKYICRWNRKNGMQDVEKAIWYATKLRDILEEESKTYETKKESNETDSLWGTLPSPDAFRSVRLPSNF